MMIKINLLSDNNKEEKQLEQNMGIILRAGLSVVFSLLVLCGLLVAIQAVLNIELKAAQADTLLHPVKSEKDIIEAEKIINNANAISTKIESTSKQIPYWSKVFAALSNDASEGLKLKTLHIEKLHVKITGFAKTRDSFLAFQDKLKAEGFGSLVSPVSNLVSPENFDFSIEFDVDKNYLNKL